MKINCKVCDREIEISKFQLEMMRNTIMVCSHECAVKVESLKERKDEVK